jgi:hypothetical protein
MNVEWYVYWVVACGLVFNAWFVWMCARIVWAIAYTALAAASFTRFAWACGREHGFAPRRFPLWVYAPSIWFSFFATSLGAEKGTLSTMGGSGVWNGVGDWTVYPAKETS